MTFSQVLSYAAKRGLIVKQIALRRIILTYNAGYYARTYRLVPRLGGYAWLSEFES